MLIPTNRTELILHIRGAIACAGVDVSLNTLDVSNVTNLVGVFSGIDFNGDISGWDVSGAVCLGYMFSGSTFKGDISGWDVSGVLDVGDIFKLSKHPQKGTSKKDLLCNYFTKIKTPTITQEQPQESSVSEYLKELLR